MYVIKKDIILRSLLSKLGAYHAILSAGEVRIGQGKKPTIRIDVTKKAGNKVGITIWRYYNLRTNWYYSLSH